MTQGLREGETIYIPKKENNLNAEVNSSDSASKIVIKIDKKYFRPCEVNRLVGDSTKANKKLGWYPKTKLEELVADMIKNDKELAKKEALLIQKGYELNIPKE